MSVLANTTALMRSDTAALFGRTYSRRAHEYSTEWPQHAGSACPRRGAHRMATARRLCWPATRRTQNGSAARGLCWPATRRAQNGSAARGLCWPATRRAQNGSTARGLCWHATQRAQNSSAARGLCWPATLVCSVSRTISWRGDRTGTVEAGQSGAGRTVIPPSVTVLSALSPPPALISEGLCLFLLSVKCSVQNAAAFFDFTPDRVPVRQERSRRGESAGGSGASQLVETEGGFRGPWSRSPMPG